MCVSFDLRIWNLSVGGWNRGNSVWLCFPCYSGFANERVMLLDPFHILGFWFVCALIAEPGITLLPPGTKLFLYVFAIKETD